MPNESQNQLSLAEHTSRSLEQGGPFDYLIAGKRIASLLFDTAGEHLTIVFTDDSLLRIERQGERGTGLTARMMPGDSASSDGRMPAPWEEI